MRVKKKGNMRSPEEHETRLFQISKENIITKERGKDFHTKYLTPLDYLVRRPRHSIGHRRGCQSAQIGLKLVAAKHHREHGAWVHATAAVGSVFLVGAAARLFVMRCGNEV